MTRELQPCGTYAAYRRHIRHGEVPCRPCSDAAAAWARPRQQARRAERGYVRGPYGVPQCGTYSGYMAHRYRRQGTCQPCRDAAAAYKREQKARRLAKAVAA